MDLLFSVSWYLPTALAAVGIFVFLTGNKRLDAKLKAIGAALILLAILWATVSYVVETPKEKAVRHTKALIDAYKKHDWTTFRDLLDPGTTLATYANREMIVKGAEASIDHPGVTDVYQLGLEAEQRQTEITVTATVMTTLTAAMDRPVKSTWQFDYVQMKDGWTLTAITPVDLAGQDAGEIVRRLPR